jgi:hypothetical protein
MRIIRYTIGFALVLSLLCALRLPLRRCEPFIAGAPFLLDEAEYVAYANAFAIGDTSVETARPWTRAPATSYVLLSVARLRGLPPELAVCDFQALQTALWVGLTLLIAALTGLLFGARTALIAALLAAIVPDGVSLALIVHSDLLFCFWLTLTAFALFMHTRRSRTRWWSGWLILAGFSAGLGGLTRSPMLTVLPVLLLWAGARPRSTANAAAPPRLATLHIVAPPALDAGRLRAALRRTPRWLKQRITQHALPGALLLICCAAVIGPWTARNYRVHGGLIISDTLGAINLLNDNALERHQTFDAVMAAADNAVDRQRYATRTAIAVIAANPLHFAAKFLRNTALAWSPSDFKETWEFWQFLIERPRAGALLTQLDELLWLLLPLALLGLIGAPVSAPGAGSYRLAALALAGCYTIMIGIAHFEPRFRTPFLLLLLPYAAWSLTHPRALVAALRRPAAWAVIVASLALLIGFAPQLWPAQWRNAAALGLHGRGLLRAVWGDTAGALADQQAAGERDPQLREARVAAAQLQAERGDPAAAEQMLRAVLADAQQRRVRTPPDAVVALQRLLLAADRRDEFAQLDHQLTLPARRRAELLAWRRNVAPGPTLELGQDDLGLVRGFYSAETSPEATFRWSAPAAQLTLAGPGAQLCLRINAARPLDLPPPTVTIRVASAGMPTTEARLQPPQNGWSWHCVALPAARSTAAPLQIELRTTGYNPYLHDNGVDPRDLGVAVAEAALRDGPLQVDPESGLLLDRLASPASSTPDPSLQLLGLSGALRAAPGAVAPLTLWWRGPQPPVAGTFTFVHLRDAAGEVRASYNAPLAGGQRPASWSVAAPLADQTALALPADLAPGAYQLVAGAFDPASGAELLRVDLGAFEVTP